MAKKVNKTKTEKKRNKKGNKEIKETGTNVYDYQQTRTIKQKPNKMKNNDVTTVTEKQTLEQCNKHEIKGTWKQGKEQTHKQVKKKIRIKRIANKKLGRKQTS